MKCGIPEPSRQQSVSDVTTSGMRIPNTLREATGALTAPDVLWGRRNGRDEHPRWDLNGSKRCDQQTPRLKFAVFGVVMRRVRYLEMSKLGRAVEHVLATSLWRGSGIDER